LEERAKLLRDVEHAVENGEIHAVFQPVVRLDDRVVMAVEALARWEHPTAGPISPDAFIPLAEQGSAIHDIGACMLDEACRHAARWRTQRPSLPPRVSVNVSAAQLGDHSFAERVTECLTHHGLEPSGLTL